MNDTVVSCGEALLAADTERIGDVTALGLDEVLMARIGTRHRQHFTTQLVDVRRGQLLDVVPGRGSVEPMAWLAERGHAFRARICFGTLDLSGPYRKVFEVMTPTATLVADPFHVCRLVNTKLDECRRRVQNETLGHRGRKSHPLYRCRRLLTRAKERLDEKGREKLTGLLRAGDPTVTWPPCGRRRRQCASCTRMQTPSSRSSGSPSSAMTSRTPTIHPRPARSVARSSAGARRSPPGTPLVSSGPTEAVNNLIKRVKRAFDFTSFRNYRIRSLLYAGKPNWGLLATVRPR